jgi:hypothetical protein
MLLARSVDNFETYVVSIIRAVLRKQPKILSNSEYTLDMKSILDHGNIDSLVYDLIERKISSLSYDGFESLHSWCNERGIALSVPAGKQDEIIELIATRNVIAHNRGAIDQKYLGIVKNSLFKAGERRILYAADFFAAIKLLGQTVETTDRAVANNFGLDIPPLETPEQAGTFFKGKHLPTKDQS